MTRTAAFPRSRGGPGFRFFPQEERLLENEYSINLPAAYDLKGKRRKSWINVINPFRSLLVIGTPGAGKSYFVVRHIITQHIRKAFTMFIYDFKFDDLSRIAYNTLLKYAHIYRVKPKFYVINFEDLSRTHRCNPLDPATMEDITDATESSRTIMLGLNRDWIKKQGDFFVESPINFVTAIIWFLRKYEDGKYCTLPHVIELMQLDYPHLFKLLRSEPEIEVLINPFESAFKNEAMEQLEGQIASAVGATLEITGINPDEMIEQQAKLKAEELMRIVQGTSALESQGVSESTYRSMLKQTLYRLLAGPRRRLWT